MEEEAQAEEYGLCQQLVSDVPESTCATPFSCALFSFYSFSESVLFFFFFAFLNMSSFLVVISVFGLFGSSEEPSSKEEELILLLKKAKVVKCLANTCACLMTFICHVTCSAAQHVEG